MRISTVWASNYPAEIRFRVVNGALNTVATLSAFVNGSNTQLEPRLFICNQAGMVFSSISESSAVQHQLNRINVDLEFNFEIVKGTLITISGLLNCTTPDNDQLALDDGVSYLLGYSGRWTQNTGTLIVQATDTLNLNNRNFLISFTVQNGGSAIFAQRLIKVALGLSVSTGTCGGQICELLSPDPSLQCRKTSMISPSSPFIIPTPPNFLTFYDVPRFVTFEVRTSYIKLDILSFCGFALCLISFSIRFKKAQMSPMSKISYGQIYRPILHCHLDQFW